MPRQARQASFAGEDCEKTGKRNGTVEYCLVGLLATSAVVLPHQTGAVLARYNPGQDVYSPVKPAIYSRLARRIYILTWAVSGKNRSGLVRQNYYRAS